MAAGQQKARTRRARKGKAAAEAFIDKTAAALAEANTAEPVAKQKRKGIEQQVADLGITEEAIVKARDTDGSSWKGVAVVLGLGSPSAARAAYALLTGRSHTTSQMTGKRAPRGSSSAGVLRPEWDNDTPTEDIEAQLEPNTRIYVQRQYRNEPEEISVYHLLYFDTHTTSGEPMDLTVCFTEGVRKWDAKQERWFNDGTNAFRAVFVKDIVEVR